MTQRATSFKSTLGRVRGKGSVKSGTEHWMAQRLSAIILLFLGGWFLFFLARHVGCDYLEIRASLQSFFPTTFMILFILAALHHAQLGLQVVIEDYVHRESLKLFLIYSVKFIAFAAALIASLSVLKILFSPV